MKVVVATLCLLFTPFLRAEMPVEGLWSKPVVIGASVADGFDKTGLFGPKSEALSLDLFLDKAVIAKHGRFDNRGSMLVFTRPKQFIQSQIDYIKANPPSVVISPDFLFWFLYGTLETERERLALLEEGLKLLEVVNCPIVVGDIPDARHAGGGILNKNQLPQVVTIQRANQRIREWVSGRNNAALISLSDFMRRVRANEEVEIRSLKVPKGSTAQLLQADQLHPTQKGAALIALASLDALQKLTKFPATEVSWTEQ